ncbi:uncharacterized protein LOC123920527 isoform X1 [Trifolium pratense]|uniref:uncharacterized protein LOC123920527 isoform X1 n=1 Tax=Trifolium pratense TaxID=57577 RepID=UPI001E691C74|nr:uncharacterized protein LOC123920527 isoform X1 [Trifolium pratense]XP_045828748.1 uncharacterized protein LOC123920527 isoform X1 [Trifolium pratense]XP_045828749.1 uncharacterized protein LOC123920527 isoform X1 [Trifolium pratense]
MDRLKSRIPTVPYDLMFPYLIYDHPDKAKELQALFDKYKRDEIPKYVFVRLLVEIVGDDQQVLSALIQMRKKRILPLTVNEQSKTQISSRLPVLPYDQMFPFLFPEIHNDKAKEIQALFDKYKRGEIPKYDFVSLMKDIAGEEKLRSAEAKLKQQKRYLPVTVNEQPRTQINFTMPVMPYDQMFPFLFPEIHNDEAKEIQALFDKYKRGEIPKYDFVSLMKGIAGEEKLRSAEAKLKQQKRYLPVTVNEQPRTQINFTMPVVPYDQMFPFLFHEIDQDKAGELKDLFDKYKRDEIPRNTFYSLMKDIVGEELLLSASEKLQQVNELFRTQISFSLPVVPFDQMFPFLFPEIHKDKANEIQASFDKYKRGEIPKYDFVSFMKGIVGEEKLRSVEAILKQQKTNLLVPVNEHPRVQINSSERVLRFDQLFPFLISHIDPDKAIGLQTLFDKYKRGQIGEHTFVPFMKGILGEQMLRSAKVKQRKRSQLFPVNKQPRTQINSSELVLPFDQLIPLLISQIDPDKAIELEVFFDKYKRGEIPEHTFVSVMKGILGEQMLRIVTEKVKRQNITNTGSYGTSL